METIEFTSLTDILKEVRKIESLSFEEFKALRAHLNDSKAQVIPLIEKETITSLNRFTMKGKKSQMVKSTWNSIMSAFVVSGSITVDYFAGETYDSALNKAFEAITEQDFNKWKADQQAERERVKKCIENPETLQEFHECVRYKGLGFLTSEQLARFDDLKAGRTREIKAEDRERKNEVTRVTLEGVEMELHESRHTKKDIPLWVVTLSSRVDRDAYQDLNSKAKALGGYYSKYNKDGAIPGFTFESEEGAKMFVGLQEENQNSTAIKEEREEFKKLSRVEQLRVKAERMESAALEVLEAERKDNTVRRARMAASIEGRATSQIFFAKMMHKIADAMELGEIKYLDRLQNITELTDLQRIISRAKEAYIKAKEIKRDNFEMCMEVIDFVRFPYPRIYKENALKVAYHAQWIKGRVLSAKSIVKSLSKHEDGKTLIVTGPRALENYNRVFCSPYKSSKYEFSKWECEQYLDQWNTLKRLERIDITTVEELRASLRELLRIKGGVEMDPELKRAQELKELERKFIGRKIEGFFPTPEALAVECVEDANIEEADKICEPNAGLGHIAQVIKDRHPANSLQCIELHYDLSEALKVKGFNVVHGDFLEHTERYDKIIMNPPFENLQDIDHVIHAFNLLNPGGRVVAIMAGNKDGDRARIQHFRELVDQYGTIESNEAGAFLSSFRPTGVSTVKVILDKPKY